LGYDKVRHGLAAQQTAPVTVECHSFKMSLGVKESAQHA